MQTVAGAGVFRQLPVVVTVRRQPTLAVAVVAAWAVIATMPHAMHSGGFDVRLAWWAVMCTAMMLPAALPATRHVARNSLSWRRGRAVAAFVTVYLGIWIGFGATALLLWEVAPTPTAPFIAALLVLAACWELTPLKRRALLRCHRSVPLAPRGWPATRSLIRFGLRNGGACLASCWALMLVMALVTSGHLLWMAGLTAIVSAQKLMPKPRRTTRIGATALGGAAALVLALGGSSAAHSHDHHADGMRPRICVIPRHNHHP
jgi:predicted metal-binding membrane protein